MRRVPLLLLALALGLGMPAVAADQSDQTGLARITSLIQTEGRARVLVELRLPAGSHVPEGRLSAAAATIQRQDIARVGAAVASRLQATGSKLRHRYESLPYLAVDVDAAGLSQLLAAGIHVSRIFEDRPLVPVLYQSGPLVQADQTAALGFDGSGWTVAIIDTGVDKTHPFLTGKVVSEACYVSDGGCPNGLSSQTGSGAAAPFSGQYHGTHVAGIAAGNGPAAVPPPNPMMSGVGRGARIIAINVFGPYDLAMTSDVIAGLNRVYALRSTLSIAAVNLSLGLPFEGHSSTCDTLEAPTKTAIDQLRSVNIATVIASGDDGFTNGVSRPSCVSSAISVGSTTKNDTVSSFSNVSSILSLLAPGSSIYSSIPGGSYTFLNGSSMSAPHVTGAWAVLRQASPNATVSQILAALRSSGVPITDSRPGGTVTTPRIEVKDAMALLAPTPASLSPTSGTQGSSLSVTITGTNFTTGPTVDFGAGITVSSATLQSPTQIRANITIAANAAPGTRTVTVTRTDGAMGKLPNAFTISQPPPTIASLSPSTAQGFGPAFTLTVNGTNFISSSVVQVNGSNRTTTFVNATQLTAAIPASDLATTATSLSITVFTPAPGGGASVPANVTLTQPSITVSATTTPPGGAVTATLSNAPGGSADWLGLAVAGAADTSYVQWTYVGAGVTTRTWTVTMPATVGSYEFRLYLNNGYTVAARSPAVAVANINATPAITGLSPASVAAGSGGFTLTVTGTGFAAGATATVGGVGRAVTVVSATQLTIGVQAGDVGSVGSVNVVVTNPGPCVSGGCVSNTAGLGVTAAPAAPVLTGLSPASVGAGGPAFTLTATGQNFAGNSVVQVNGSARATVYVSGTQLTAQVLASDIAVGGTLSVTVFTPAPGGGTSGVQGLTVVGPSLAVSPDSTLGLQPVTVTLSNSPGNSTDWLALAVAGSPDTSYQQWTYVGAGVTTRTWAPTMPNAGGNYEFRLYLNNGYTVAARSPQVLVTQDLRGIYTATASLTQSGCANSANNGTASWSGTLNISSQSGGSVLGTAVLNTSVSGVIVQTTINITSGTVTPPSAPPTSTVNGAFTWASTYSSITLMSGTGMLAGTSIPNQISANISAQATSGEICQISGPLSASK